MRPSADVAREIAGRMRNPSLDGCGCADCGTCIPDAEKLIAAALDARAEEAGERVRDHSRNAAHDAIHDSIVEMTECGRVQADVDAALSALDVRAITRGDAT